GENLLHVPQVSPDHRGGLLVSHQRLGVQEYHGIVVDVNDTSIRMPGLGDLVGIGTGRQPGPDVEELADSAVAQEPSRVHQELAVCARAVPDLWRDLEGHFGRLPVAGEVVLTAQKVVVDPGWMRDICADPQCLPSVVPFLLILPGHRASPHSFAAQMMPHQAWDGRTRRNAAARAGAGTIGPKRCRLALTRKGDVRCQPPNWPYLGQSGGRNWVRTSDPSLARRDRAVGGRRLSSPEEAASWNGCLSTSLYVA